MEKRFGFLMAPLAFCMAAGLSACAAPAASPDATTNAIALLPQAPERAYQSLGFVEVRGLPGTPRRTVHDQLRDKARALGAEAVIVSSDAARTNLPLRLPADPKLGEPRPDPLERTDRGPAPAPARPASTAGGVYYEVSGEAIRFTGPSHKQGG